MLFAERHKKLGREGSRAHDRAEDLLTSTAFQLIRYLPLEQGLLEVLRRVRAVGAGGQIECGVPSWLRTDGVLEADYDFWPCWPGFGEPDVLITLRAGAERIAQLVIEVKLDAGKSGEADEETASEETNRDQLCRYWQGLAFRSAAPRLGVIYLTAHAAPPTEELQDSLAREPGYWLGWLSWRDVWLTMNKIKDCLPARDLADILNLKGLNAFNGFAQCEAPVLRTNPVFWSDSSRWFGGRAFRPMANPRFWKGRI